MTHADLLKYIEEQIILHKPDTAPHIIAQLARRQLVQDHPDLVPVKTAPGTATEEKGLAELAGGDPEKKPGTASGAALNDGAVSTAAAPAGTVDLPNLNKDDLKTYIGTKLIKAKPLNRGDYNQYRGWEIPADENPADPGYLVVYDNNYESWSPKDVFEAAYREITDSEIGLIAGEKF